MPSISDYVNALNANAVGGNTNAIPSGYALIYSSWGDAQNTSQYSRGGINGALYYNSTTRQFMFAFNGPNTILALSGSGAAESNPTLADAGKDIDMRILQGDATVTRDMSIAVNRFYDNAQLERASSKVTCSSGLSA